MSDQAACDVCGICHTCTRCKWTVVLHFNLLKTDKILVSNDSFDKLLEYVVNNHEYDETCFLGLGGTCILAFLSKVKKNAVVKICLKNELLSNVDKFVKSHMMKLIECDVPTVPVFDQNAQPLYENNEFIVYEQDYCEKIDAEKFNTQVFTEILSITKRMLTCGYGVTDIYFTNFGIYKNKICLFDYHEVNRRFGFDDIFYIVQLTEMFNLVNTNFNHDVAGKFSDIYELENSKYGFGILSDVQMFLLETLHKYSKNMCSLEKVVGLLDEIIFSLRTKNTFSVVNYQEIYVDMYGVVNLFSHTNVKYEFLHKNLPWSDLKKDCTLIDFGCSLGGIACKVAQTHPEFIVTANNITSSERDLCSKILEKTFIRNLKIDSRNVCEVVDEVYDVTCYFALLHHIMKSMCFKEIVELVYKQTGSYSVVELPFKGDALLDMVKPQGVLTYEETFKYLESVELFTESISKWFEVLYSEKIDYGIRSTDLNRVAFVLRKKYMIE